MNYEPLTESYYYILLCLFRGRNHGYGIMTETEQLSSGRVKIGSGTMYGAISNMLKKGWIQESISNDPGDYRKRQYELTSTGRDVFTEEVNRLSELLKNVRDYGVDCKL